ncbi:TIM-barrel domain-containing protein [Mangrovibacterium marinum]|uniref:Alpha-glucosidase (Family GH31 glycosyl hydrolase) n=1 Tax=Mangrovibacterium marinum TaxID=1639118 RepID=A0A2T5BYG8_9BACT|nr:TIM-barrel domain-containing protein [Mangrovibacterium marinum]PTN07288.1 alpha-glucosidase (family GH31 glycosyl hydrolase) [Mangrovibacterium marinum]
MKRVVLKSGAFLAFAWLFFSSSLAFAQDETTAKTGSGQEQIEVLTARKTNSTTVEIEFSNQQKMVIDFYGDNIFRMFQDPRGKGLRAPQAEPPAEILVQNPRKAVLELQLKDAGNTVSIQSSAVLLTFDKTNATFELKNTTTGKTVVRSLAPIAFGKDKVELQLSEQPNEYFYGGGVQNGRFSHKGKVIAIENQNSWTDGGVASPTPFFWSTNGYGFMAYTFAKGNYNFGAKGENRVALSHDTGYLDVFFMVSDGAVALLNDFYQLTGQPVLIPKFGFYEGHLNAYNRDYWKEDSAGILFEDGKRYRESQKENGGIKESLNGEKNNYQFSARAVVDRYAEHDMPLGWILPNDGYGAGYGQTSTLDGNIANLKEFGDYARGHGVEIGLWTQSDLHPIDTVEALLQRDIVKEVGVAGVRVLKTDVAWVGAGYSFGLNGVQDAAEIMQKEGNQARPFIISLDGWAGTQRYATIWSGDQTGGKWEYIRFHIPTFIGSGLSGQPNITNDMDGIFGGKNSIVNIRDFQWKTFTLMQLNMDGWGANEKYPQALGEPATSINRNYLKLKSELLPYAYTVAREAVDGMPAIRAMFLEEENPYTLGKNTQYQFMFGPDFLVAPIYQNTKSDSEGNDIRNQIYLPEGNWVDYFTGEIYAGGRIINNFEAPIWKLPVFVKMGAIIPMVDPNNNVNEIDRQRRIYEFYPSGQSSFVEYDDDGLTTAYQQGQYTKTRIGSVLNGDQLSLVVEPAKGTFAGFVNEKETELRINLSREPGKIAATIGDKKVKLKRVNSLADFKAGTNVYYYNAAPDMNRFATAGSEFEQVKMIRNPQLMVKIEKTDISQNRISLQFKGYAFESEDRLLKSTGELTEVKNAAVSASNATAYSLTPSWDKIANADCYEIQFQGMLYANITDNELLFENLEPETTYEFSIRAVNKSGHSDWTHFTAKTKADPLQFALKGLTAVSSAKMQGGQGLNRLFDFDENSMMHTDYAGNSVPFDMVIDLKSVSQLEKIVYLPRMSGRNGIIQSGAFQYSKDKENWTDAGRFEWKADNQPKTFELKDQPVARYLKMEVDKAYGDFGSGRQLYIFKVPGTESFLPGDINSDGVIDSNDLTSYLNYTGLRKDDSDFGYVSRGDVNENGLIDAYDISNVATQLDGGVSSQNEGTLAGELHLNASKRSYKAGEIVELKVEGRQLEAVNAFSCAIPYSPSDLEYVGVKTMNTKGMDNMTYNRLHSNGDRVLYPTFVNVGGQPALRGDGTILTIQFKAKRAFTFGLELQNGLLIDKQLNTVNF